MKKVKILAIGDELLRGDIVDTNTAWLATQLNYIGFSLQGAGLAADNIDSIARELGLASLDSDLIITTGGLGPTSDDLTRDAVSKFLGLPLLENSQSLSRLGAHAKKRGRELHAAGRRQAYFPEGAEIFINTLGTADAFLVKKAAKVIVSLPGVPREMKNFFENDLKPWLIKFYPEIYKAYKKHLRVFGLSESYLGTLVDNCNLDSEISVSYRASFPEVKLSFFSENQAKLNQVVEEIKERIGREFIFTEEENKHLSNVVFELLKERKQTISFAESCSGGKLADQLISIPGSSEVLLASIVSYSNSAKTSFLGVSKETLEKYGAVSREVAIEMAEGVRIKTASDYGISVTGIAGPDGGSVEKPVGSVWFGISTKNLSEAYYFCYKSERNAFRAYVSTLALDLLRRLILDHPRTWETR